MEKYQVIGFQRKSGEYNGIKYDNYVFSCIRPAHPDNEKGDIAVLIKVKADLLQSLPEIGDEVTPYYDRFGRVASL